MAVVYGAAGRYLRRTTGLPASSTSITVAAWLYIDSLRSSQYQYWLCIENAATNATKYIVQGYASSGRWDAVNTDVNVAGGTEPPTGQWLFMALTCAGTGSTDAKGYFKTIAATSFTVSSAPGTSFTPAAIYIGNDSYDEWTNTRSGPVYVFDRVLTEAELLQLSQAIRPVVVGTMPTIWSPIWNSSNVEDLAGGAAWTVGGTLTNADNPPVSWGAAPWIVPFVASSGAQTIAPNAIASTSTVYAPVVTPGAVTIAPNAIASTATVYAPTVANGAATISPNAIASTATVYAPTVTPGAATISPNAIASTAGVYAPDILTNACIGGVLRVNASNGRYFETDAGPVLLAGFHTWYSLQDGGDTDPPAALDWDEYLGALISNGCNFTKLWFMETARDWPDAAPQYFTPHPWQRTGPGNAADGKLKFDLTAFDQDYFARLRARAVEAGNAGIFVCVQLFQGWHVELKNYTTGDPWAYHPFENGNNINSIDGDTDNDGNGLETRTTTLTAVYNLQKSYVEQVLDTLNDLDNVIYEISNEDNPSSKAWQHALIDYIHTYESGLPKQHAVGITKMYRDGSNADLTDSNAEWLSLDDQLDTPDTADGSFVICADTDHMAGLTTDHKWLWRHLCAGNNIWYMDPWDGALYGTDTRANATYNKIRANLGYALDYAAQIDLASATPQSSLASTGYCLANTTKIIAYQPTSGNFTVDLTTFSGTFAVEFLRTSTGATTAGSNVSGGAVRTMTAPWAGEDFVALLEKLADEIYPNAISSTATVYAPTITPGAVTIAPSAISSAATVYQPTVTPGAVTIAPDAIASATQVYAPTVTPGAVTLAPDAISSTAAVYAPTLTSGAILYPVAIASTATVHAPMVTPGATTIAPDAIGSTAAVYEPVITSGGFVVQPDAIASTATVYQPAVTPGTVTVAADAITSTATVHQPALTPGAVTVTLIAIDSTATVHQPAVTQSGVMVYPDAIASAAQVYAPTVAPGAATVQVAAIDSTATVYGPNVYQGSGQTVFVAAIASTAQVFSVAITAIVAGRIYRVAAEDRTYRVPAENRTYTVTGD